MRNFLVGIQKICDLGTKLNTIIGVRNLYSGLNYNSVHNNNVMSLMTMNFHESVPRGNFVLQGSSKLLQLAGSNNNAINYTFNRNITNMDVIIQNRICDPSIQNDETLQLDSVLRKRRKKMKKHKLRKRRKREKALKRKISQGQKK